MTGHRGTLGIPDDAVASLDLHWVPLGAGASVVRFSGRCYEALTATMAGRRRRSLFHAALTARVHGADVAVEVAPVPDDDGASRGVVGGGPVGVRALGRFRVFRYEIRRWEGGTIPDLVHALGPPVRVSDDIAQVRHVLDLLEVVPTPTWGRDELGAGEMWNSNSVVSWTLARAGLLRTAGVPPPGGRAPGWDAGITIAQRLAPVPSGHGNGTSDPGPERRGSPTLDGDDDRPSPGRHHAGP